MVIKKLILEEKVIWDEKAYPTLLPSMIKNYGKGPFEVVGLRLKKPIVGTGWDSSVAPYSVTVMLANGKRQEFAGEWFRRA